MGAIAEVGLVVGIVMIVVGLVLMAVQDHRDEP